MIKHTTIHKSRHFKLTVFNTGNVKGTLVLSCKYFTFWYYSFGRLYKRLEIKSPFFFDSYNKKLYY